MVFNDPYDSRTYWCLNGKREKHINHLMHVYGFTQEESEHIIDDAIDQGTMTINGDLICYDPAVEINLDINGYSWTDLHGYSQKKLPKVCCFSGKYDNILMWSHYADSHQGICLRFKSKKYWDNELGEYYLERVLKLSWFSLFLDISYSFNHDSDHSNIYQCLT